MSTHSSDVRVGVDIGGTFTDIAVQIGNRFVTTKVLTTPRAPEQAVLQGIASALAEAGVKPTDVDLVIHGTTLATNALIERKGARTAFIGTEGHRDTLELGYEDRFSEYDVFIEKPAPLIPRDLRFTVPERMGAKGQVLRPLDEQAVAALVPELQEQKVAGLAIGLLEMNIPCFLERVPITLGPKHSRKLVRRSHLHRAIARLAANLRAGMPKQLPEPPIAAKFGNEFLCAQIGCPIRRFRNNGRGRQRLRALDLLLVGPVSGMLRG